MTDTKRMRELAGACKGLTLRLWVDPDTEIEARIALDQAAEFLFALAEQMKTHVLVPKDKVGRLSDLDIQLAMGRPIAAAKESK